jgi:serpin B
MKALFIFLIAVVLSCNINAQQAYSIADSNNLFAFKLYNEVKKDKRENLFFSPFSISTALAMTYAGARNETEKQMASTLHFNSDQDAFHRDYKTFLEKIGSDTGKDLIMGIANSLWIANSFKLLAPFQNILTTDYNSEAKNVDFSKSEQIRQEINAWVEGKTNDKIQDLIKPHMLSASTKLVLVNAIYFKGKWKFPFSKDSTKTDDFYKSDTSSIKTKFMHNTAHYTYYEDTSLQAIEIPYSGGRVSMVVILPKERDGINTLENQLNYLYYSKIISSFGPKKVIVALPKFKTTASFQLEGVLANMGMPDAFSNANFSGISHESLYISHVIHKAFIDVNEEGTEAAAATAVVMRQMAMRPMPVPVFNANHPFIFVIRDTMTGGILFMGKIMDPTKE